MGGGSSGAVLASRLSEDADIRVLLLEAGPEADDFVRRAPGKHMAVAWSNPRRTPRRSRSVPRRQRLRFPAFYAFLQRGGFDWQFRTEAQPHQRHRTSLWPRGRVLGGCSSINAMIYVRGDSRTTYRSAANGA